MSFCRPQVPLRQCQNALLLSFFGHTRRHLASAHSNKLQPRYDVIVVGSGASGLTAAVVAAKKGLKVLVLEKTKYFGGTTAYSGGAPWIPANKFQPSLGVQDDTTTADIYLRQVLGPELYKSAEKNIKAYLESAPEMLNWMEDNTTVKFQPVPLPDYQPHLPGASKGRTILPVDFNGRLLGQQIRNIRYTLQGFTAFGSMQVTPMETDILSNPFGSVSNFTHAMKKGMGWTLDLILYGKGSFMASGNALVGRLIYSAIQSGVTLEREMNVVKPLKEGQRVTGVLVSSKDGTTTPITAAKGVVLATGGFGRSPESKKYVPQEWSAVPSTNVGDGIRIGLEAGGVLPPPNPDNAIYAPLSLLQYDKTHIRRLPHFSFDRTKPGSIIVDQQGRRFTNESENYQSFVKKMHDLGIPKCYYIGDKNHLRKYGMGMALPWPYWNRNVLKKGYLIKARTIPELAGKLQIPKETLSATISRFNEFAKRGVDEEFHRGENIYDQFYGDPSKKPNPSLGPVEKGPFYALPLYPGNVSVMYGLATNEDAQVLSKDGGVVEGLYAAGCDNNSIMRGSYPGGGSSIGPAMTFGYRAAMHMARSDGKGN